jgi:hypothetical protein
VSTTTVGDLLDRADRQARALRHSVDPVALISWTSFEHTAHRLLRELVGPLRTTDPGGVRAHANLIQLLDDFPPPSIPKLQAKTAPVVVEPARPADPSRTEPLDQLAVTLGVLADLLSGARQQDLVTWTGSELDRMLDDAQTAPVIAHLMGIITVAGRHAMAGLPLDQVERPLAVTGYAEHALDTLANPDRDSMLLRLASFAPPNTPATANEQLESALRTWADAARSELARTIPSTEVLRNVTNQAVHLYAATDHLLDITLPSEAAAADEVAAARTSLRDAAVAMQRVEPLWAGVTTATRPSHEYVTTATTLYGGLNEILAVPSMQHDHQPTCAGLDVQQALTDLSYMQSDLADLLHASAEMPEVLIRSQLLYAPARVLPCHVERLRARQLGQWVALLASDDIHLGREALAGAHAATTAHRVLGRSLAQCAYPSDHTSSELELA